ncbi:MAG: rod-binding protein [Deltaproteobacteria bacterium]|nr:rod-binding protein [Deltaproteobacteria bacterium]
MTLEALSTLSRSKDWKETSIGKVGNPADSVDKDLSKDRLKGAVKDLEALFFYEILKEMRQSTQGGFLGKGMGNDLYGSLFDMEMAKLFAGRGLGLGQIILKQIERRGENGPENPSSTPKELKGPPSG